MPLAFVNDQDQGNSLHVQTPADLNGTFLAFLVNEGKQQY